MLFRLSDLDALQDFLSAAAAELSWLNGKEQIELNRDWADKSLDLPNIHRYYEVSRHYFAYPKLS